MSVNLWFFGTGEAAIKPSGTDVATIKCLRVALVKWNLNEGPIDKQSPMALSLPGAALRLACGFLMKSNEHVQTKCMQVWVA